MVPGFRLSHCNDSGPCPKTVLPHDGPGAAPWAWGRGRALGPSGDERRQLSRCVCGATGQLKGDTYYAGRLVSEAWIPTRLMAPTHDLMLKECSVV